MSYKPVDHPKGLLHASVRGRHRRAKGKFFGIPDGTYLPVTGTAAKNAEVRKATQRSLAGKRAARIGRAVRSTWQEFFPGTPRPVIQAAPPCFFFDQCSQLATREKQGKSVCASCAKHLSGQEFPLRSPDRSPLYSLNSDIIRAMDMD